jgi:predicted Rossmann-fold nucleotide-binding protein
MEAAKRGQREATAVGGIKHRFPFEQMANPYIDRDNLSPLINFFVRKVMFLKYAQGFIVLTRASEHLMSFSRQSL